MPMIPDFARRRLRLFIPLALLGGGLALLAVGVIAWLAVPTDRAYSLIITAGDRKETRAQIAEYLAERARDSGVSLTVVETSGSADTLSKIARREIDLALVQGGIRPPAASPVRQVAALHLEPLHLLARADLAGRVRAEGLAALAGCRVNLSTPGSGSRLLAARVLRFAGLRAEGQAGDGPAYRASDLGYGKIFAELGKPAESRDLPDAFFFVATPPSRLARQLVAGAGYRLVPLDFARAFAMISLAEDQDADDPIDPLHVGAAVVPEYAYSVVPPVPDAPCPTLGTRLLLVAGEDVPAEAVTRLLPLLETGPLKELYQYPAPGSVEPEFPPHAGLTEYLERDRPIVRAEVIEQVQRFASVAGPLVGGFLALSGYYWCRRLLRFTSYFQRVNRLELIALGVADDPDLPAHPAKRNRALLEAVDRLRRRAVSDFCGNYLRGEGVLLSLLHLTRELRSRLEAESEQIASTPAAKPPPEPRPAQPE